MEIFCPAKVNLMLAVTGRRPDGFHEIVSVMAPLDLGDTLRIEEAPEGERTFSCSDSALPMDDNNLVVRAARLFESAHPTARGYRLHLTKNIPSGAGLGGGSSDAAGTLRLLNRWADHPLEGAKLATAAAQLGADCPFFLEGRPMIARGRGERLEALPEEACERLLRGELLLLKPAFGVPTPWAYGRMRDRGGDYCDASAAEERLRRWLNTREAPVSELFFNNMEAAVFEKYVALPVLKERLVRVGRAVVMSGSGSTLIVGGGDLAAAECLTREAWGEPAWVRRVRMISSSF